MFVLVSYDVETKHAGGQKRLRRVAKACKNFGQRVQYSVFECEVDPAQWERMKDRLLGEYEPDTDSLRFYHLGAKWESKVEHHGAKPAVDMKDLLLL